MSTACQDASRITTLDVMGLAWERRGENRPKLPVDLLINHEDGFVARYPDLSETVNCLVLGFPDLFSVCRKVSGRGGKSMA